MTLTRDRAQTAQSEDRPLEEGAVIGGKYHVERALGRGAFAWVYLARHAEIPSLKLAVKVLRAHVAFDKDIRVRFRAEAVLAAQLQSPHVVRVTDYGSPEGQAPYIVMEFVEGETLNERIARHGPVPEKDVARLGIHIAQALQEAHRAGIVHRDLKPSNIYLVDPQRGSDFTAKVLDFGIAKVLTGLSAAEMVAFQTASLSINCTPRYAAPELLRGSPSAQSDIYALGITMVEALNGRPPYTSDNTFETAAQHLADSPVPLGTAESSRIGPIIRKACAKDPEERYFSAKGLLADLLEVFEQTGRPRDRNYRSEQSVIVRDETDERPSVSASLSGSVPATPPAGFETTVDRAGMLRDRVSDETVMVPSGLENPTRPLARSIVPLIGIALLLTSAAGLLAIRYSSGNQTPSTTEEAVAPPETEVAAVEPEGHEPIAEDESPAVTPPQASAAAQTLGRATATLVAAQGTEMARTSHGEAIAEAPESDEPEVEDSPSHRDSRRADDRRGDDRRAEDRSGEREEPAEEPARTDPVPVDENPQVAEAEVEVPTEEPAVEPPGPEVEETSNEEEENPFGGLNTIGR